jgi:nitrous oxidase accessory protein
MIVENNVRYISIDGSHNIVCVNRITNGGRGLYLGWGINNTVCGNFISNNNIGAFVVGGTSSVIENGNGTWITNNTIYHNNFIDNKYQTGAGNPEYGDYMYEMVTGYPGYPINYYDKGIEGNYWSNYRGTDTNRDGIGDLPYLIDFFGNKDQHPLMKPFNTSKIEIELPEWTQERISIKFIPEFPSLIFLIFLVVGTLISIIARNKIRKKI